MPAASLTSVRSDRVTAVRKLHERSGRRKSGRFLVEGPQAVEAAFAAGVGVHEVFVDVDAAGAVLSLADSGPVRATWATGQVLAAMGETQASQGIVAVCDLITPPSLDEVCSMAGPVVFLDAVADPGNVGTIIRTADAVGAAGVVLGPGCADPYNGKVVRSTAGSCPTATGRWKSEPADLVAAARHAGRAILALAGEGAEDLFRLPPALLGRPVWVVGSEAHGVGEQSRREADCLVRIPMDGRAESLNAAVAASVALYVSASRLAG